MRKLFLVFFSLLSFLVFERYALGQSTSQKAISMRVGPRVSYNQFTVSGGNVAGTYSGLGYGALVGFKFNPKDTAFAYGLQLGYDSISIKNYESSVNDTFKGARINLGTRIHMSNVFVGGHLVQYRLKHEVNSTAAASSTSTDSSRNGVAFGGMLGIDLTFAKRFIYTPYVDYEMGNLEVPNTGTQISFSALRLMMEFSFLL